MEWNFIRGNYVCYYKANTMYLVGNHPGYGLQLKRVRNLMLLPMGCQVILKESAEYRGHQFVVLAGVVHTNGIIEWLFQGGLEASGKEAHPPVYRNRHDRFSAPAVLQPVMFLFLVRAAAQLGILSRSYVDDLKDAASIGIIGAADGPTSILVLILHSKYWFR